MKALFLHQNCPGQFRHLAPALAARGDDVVFISQKDRPTPRGVRKIEYEPHRTVTEGIHPYLASTEAAVLNGQAVARLCLKLKAQGWTPDVVVGNPGWGETLYIKDVWPDVPLLLMVEFFYRGSGSDVGFDPEFDLGPDAPLRARTRSAPHLLAIEAADAAYAPTEWQRDQFPAAYRRKIEVIHDGIDCREVQPRPDAIFTPEGGPTLTRADEVLTYVARNLEPYRGFHSFMRALPGLLEARPEAEVVIVGGEGVSYGARPKDGRTWREVMLDETGPLPDRVHFTGQIPRERYLDLLSVSSVHAYFTYPFVLSWSMIEAMAMRCLVVGSRTPPVEEVIRDGENGWLVDFFDTDAIAARLADALAARNDVSDLLDHARATVQAGFDLASCLPGQISLIDRLAAGQG